MHRFLTHDAIQGGVFNRDFCSAAGQLTSWSKELTNSPQTLNLLVQRLEADWLALNRKSRKPWPYAYVDSQQHSAVTECYRIVNRFSWWGKRCGVCSCHSKNQELPRGHIRAELLCPFDLCWKLAESDLHISLPRRVANAIAQNSWQRWRCFNLRSLRALLRPNEMQLNGRALQEVSTEKDRVRVRFLIVVATLQFMCWCWASGFYADTWTLN